MDSPWADASPGGRSRFASSHSLRPERLGQAASLALGVSPGAPAPIRALRLDPGPPRLGPLSVVWPGVCPCWYSVCRGAGLARISPVISGRISASAFATSPCCGLAAGPVDTPGSTSAHRLGMDSSSAGGGGALEAGVCRVKPGSLDRSSTGGALGQQAVAGGSVCGTHGSFVPIPPGASDRYFWRA